MTEKLTADQAAKLRDLARLMDDAEGARTGSDSGQGFKRSLDVPVPYTKKKIVCGAGKAKGFARNPMKIQHFSSLQANFILTFFADITIRRILPLADVSHGPSPLIPSSATTQSIYADR